MKILILGGTAFLGRHIVEAALAGNHEVTLFNRGRQNPDLFPEVEKLRGDRDGDLKALEGRAWDSVIDTSGYLPRHVHDSAALLAEAVDHYTFISTIGVYADFTKVGIDESYPVSTLADSNLERVTPETYGALKALCEVAVEGVMPGRALSIRAGLIVGPYDPIGRLTYWVRRIARGGDVLAPGRPERQIQLIDAKDLGEWIIRMSESKQTGVYNATGPDYPLTLGRVLEECGTASASKASLVWVNDEFLGSQSVAPWDELPLWLPADHAKFAGFMSVDCTRAIAAGLTFRPLADTVRDTLEWDCGRSGPPGPYRVFDVEIRPPGLAAEREAELLAAWQECGRKEGIGQRVGRPDEF